MFIAFNQTVLTKMLSLLWLLLHLFVFFTASANLHQSPITIHSNQTWSYSYTVKIKTSCSSVPHTTDKIGLAFGDAYGNEVYQPRMDDPLTRLFERCSSYVFELRGPYLDVICYLDIMRNGQDGWKPEQVIITGPDLNPIIFVVNTFLQDKMWFSVTSCLGVSGYKTYYSYALR